MRALLAGAQQSWALDATVAEGARRQKQTGVAAGTSASISTPVAAILNHRPTT
jgi:hypothetical protein